MKLKGSYMKLFIFGMATAAHRGLSKKLSRIDDGTLSEELHHRYLRRFLNTPLT